MMQNLANVRTLVLNADMQPLSWAPLSVWRWEDAIVAVHQDRVIQVKAYDNIRIRSARSSFEVPSVVALKRYRKRKKAAFTRYHLFLRDEFTCQYCGNRFNAKELTFDHIIPRSKGGISSWRNIVACCKPDNLRKGSKTPEQVGLRLRRKPFEPTIQQLDRAAKKMKIIHGEIHQTWLDFLYWGEELEA
ncbi:5-methylcytosine-specific restriction endonuclease McrA [Paracoccus alcaliphilus]|uniref:5-methylcytosine-specific restriction endonuclease McrA n=1 Tax=Paracoccus alcaliphilus TaxID=34002 RepID=A0A1H8JEL9_9RHOB|nr:HNH endonuclease [Paracoccus alcaliphilus]WCR18126.1 HNH endonuclease [Paracoccus alcaliphilus]SEN79189.1 5-methylcytosine-specific restriction endonuclease McrA [Paracoccus alcaliphilus]